MAEVGFGERAKQGMEMITYETSIWAKRAQWVCENKMECEAVIISICSLNFVWSSFFARTRSARTGFAIIPILSTFSICNISVGSFHLSLPSYIRRMETHFSLRHFSTPYKGGKNSHFNFHCIKYKQIHLSHLSFFFFFLFHSGPFFATHS